MKKFLLFLILALIAACAPPDNRPYRPSQRLIALSFNGDTIAKLDGDNCYAYNQQGRIYHSYPNGEQTINTTAGTLICMNIP